LGLHDGIIQKKKKQSIHASDLPIDHLKAKLIQLDNPIIYGKSAKQGPRKSLASTMEIPFLKAYLGDTP
jgi:hypothetical protein